MRRHAVACRQTSLAQEKLRSIQTFPIGDLSTSGYEIPDFFKEVGDLAPRNPSELMR
ncbi:MAG: hypothetical protein ACR9NN_24110 [Nostochopsis sp.]